MRRCLLAVLLAPSLLLAQATAIRPHAELKTGTGVEKLDLVGEASTFKVAPGTRIYVWAKVPSGFTSAAFATHILDKAGVVVPAGSAYGPDGEGFIRISLTTPDDRLAEAVARIEATL